MLKEKRRIAALLLAALLLTAGLTGCSTAGETAESEPFTMTYTSLETDGFALMTENSRYQLHANGKTAEVAVTDKKTGAVWTSNPLGREMCIRDRR